MMSEFSRKLALSGTILIAALSSLAIGEYSENNYQHNHHECVTELAQLPAEDEACSQVNRDGDIVIIERLLGLAGLVGGIGGLVATYRAGNEATEREEHERQLARYASQAGSGPET
jgi:hypothetical protein